MACTFTQPPPNTAKHAQLHDPPVFPTAALSGSTKLVHLELHCPALTDKKVPDIPPKPVATKPTHGPIASMLRENAKEAALAAAEAREQEWRAQRGESFIPAVHRPLAS